MPMASWLPASNTPRECVLFPINGKCQQHITGDAAKPRVAGIHEQHASGDDSAGTVQRSSGRADAVDRLIFTRRVEVPHDSSFLAGVSAKVSVQRTGKNDAWNCGHGLGLGRTAARLRG